MKTRTKVIISIIAVLLTAALITTIVLLSYGDGIRAKIRNIEIENNGIDVKSTLSSFDNPSYRKEGNTVYFEGSKKFDLKQISNIENLSENEIESITNSTVKFKYSYDVENNIITLSATAQFVDGSLEVEELSGVGFINEDNEIDAVINVENETVLLSEMRASGMIENCGWFSRLIKNVVKAVIITATVAVVAAATVGIAVATAGLAAPALIGAGVGVAVTAGSAITGAAAGIAAGTLFAATLGTAAIKAGTAFAEAVGEGLEEVIDRTTREIQALIWEKVEYTFMTLTAAVSNNIKMDSYRITLIDKNDSCVKVSRRVLKLPIAAAFLKICGVGGLATRQGPFYGVYNYSQNSAYEVAKLAGLGAEPIYNEAHITDRNHVMRESGIFYAHYHIFGRPSGGSHAYFGNPTIVKNYQIVGI